MTLPPVARFIQDKKDTVTMLGGGVYTAIAAVGLLADWLAGRGVAKLKKKGPSDCDSKD
jgi:hypothetical protein